MADEVKAAERIVAVVVFLPTMTEDEVKHCLEVMVHEKMIDKDFYIQKTAVGRTVPLFSLTVDS